MCGIVSFFTTIHNYNIYKKLVESLKILQNRGYDSSGIGIYSTKMNISKIVGTDIDKLNQFDGYFGFGHNRWSTHGVVNEVNAHPHKSLDNKFYIVHNGTIDNFEELKKEISDYDIHKYSETDSELFVNLIQKYYDNSVEDAINKTISKIKGSFAVIIFTVHTPNKVYYCKRNLPLLLGINNNIVIGASESVIFYDNVDYYISLKDNDVITTEISNENISISKLSNYIQTRVVKTKQSITPYPFKHWTIREIFEQPLVMLKSVNMGERLLTDKVVINGLKHKKNKILKTQKVFLFGCGTSYHAGLIGSYLLRFVCNIDSECLVPSEYNNKIHNTKNNLCIYLSQSGETKDLYDLLKINSNSINISIVNVVNSLIARTTKCGIYTNAERENGVAATKSFTSHIIVLNLLVLWFHQHYFKDDNKYRIKYINYLKILPLDCNSILSNISLIKDISNTIIKLNKQSMFILGSELGYYIAKEGALKIKEISYIHTEAHYLSDLKHGPFALIEDNTPIIVIAHDKKSYETSKIICSEIKSRNGFIIFITPYDKINNIDCYIQTPNNKMFNYLLALYPLQLLAYELSVSKGYNPDFPRNLAKSVTVN